MCAFKPIRDKFYASYNWHVCPLTSAQCTRSSMADYSFLSLDGSRISIHILKPASLYFFFVVVWQPTICWSLCSGFGDQRGNCKHSSLLQRGIGISLELEVFESLQRFVQISDSSKGSVLHLLNTHARSHVPHLHFDRSCILKIPQSEWISFVFLKGCIPFWVGMVIVKNLQEKNIFSADVSGASKHQHFDNIDISYRLKKGYLVKS